MGQNYSYRIKLDPNNPLHMCAAEILDRLGRGELRQFIVDATLSFCASMGRQEALGGVHLPGNLIATRQPSTPQERSESLISTKKQPDQQNSWVQDSFNVFNK